MAFEARRSRCVVRGLVSVLVHVVVGGVVVVVEGRWGVVVWSCWSWCSWWVHGEGCAFSKMEAEWDCEGESDFEMWIGSCCGRVG